MGCKESNQTKYKAVSLWNLSGVKKSKDRKINLWIIMVSGINAKVDFFGHPIVISISGSLNLKYMGLSRIGIIHNKRKVYG